jgi:hypothetical protein
MLEDYFEEEEEQQQEASAEVAITVASEITPLLCHLCSLRGQRKGTVYKCARFDVDLCVVPCIAEYHTNYICNISPSLSILCFMIKQ